MRIKRSQISLKCVSWLVWRSDNVVRHISEVKLRRAGLVLGLVMTFGGIYPGYSGPLSLAIPP